MKNNKKEGILILICVGIVLLLGWHCPIQNLLGIPCPGCNMTTALYYLLQGKVQISLYYHAMLMPTIGITIFILVLRKNTKQVKILMWIWIVLMMIYYIYRMIYIFPQAPMVYDSENFLKIFSERLAF